MKALLQRVTKASVTVGEDTVGSIGRGLCVLIGITRDDTEKEMEYIVRKILNVRLFDDESGKKWMKSVMEMDYEILCVSQFTLDATLKGYKPDFRIAMSHETSILFYNKFLEALKSQYKAEKIQEGRFGEFMQVHIQNDGPVTIPLECQANKVPVKNKSKEISSTGDSGASSDVTTDGC